MAARVARHLEARDVAHEVLAHPATQTSSETAEAAHVSGNRVAKSVVIRDGDGYLLVVVPASHHVSLPLLTDWLGRPVDLASEQEVGRLFPDCELGAIPPTGDAYGVEVLLDEGLASLDEVCFEGGDHRSLIKVSGESFRELLSGARRGTFGTHD
jgi:Ala-tRNA(Pro) deacylase